MIISLIRHTSVLLDGSTTCYGQTDVDVSSNFFVEAETLKKSISHLNPEAVFSSPLKRARKLADYIGFSPIIEDDRLKEFNFGQLELREWSEILHEVDVEKFFEHHIEHPFPNGESLLQQQTRVKEFFDEKKNLGLKHIMVFCHGGVINCVRSLVNQQPLREIFTAMAPFATHIPIEY